MKPSIQTRSTTSIGILALLCAAATGQANMLVDPSFESNPLITFNNALTFFVANQGKWGAEAATITLATGGVIPHDGTHMLSETGNPSFYQTAQVTDVTGMSSLIDLGGQTVNLSAFFNTPNGVSAAGAAVSVTFLSGTDFNANQIGVISGSRTLDGDFTTWEQASVSGAIPANTRWLVSQVIYNAASLGSNPGFVDAANLTVVPEPTSALLLLGSGAVLLLRRRRTVAL